MDLMIYNSITATGDICMRRVLFLSVQVHFNYTSVAKGHLIPSKLKLLNTES